MTLDLLLVHIPKFENFYNPMGRFVLGNLPAMGLTAIADHVERAGFSVRVLHLGVETLEDPSFRLADYVAHHGARWVGFSLHWHYQLPDVLREARALKDAAPGVRILVGGLTASFFADALLESHPEIDAVVRGEGEVPTALLLRAETERDRADVPNLSHRDARGVTRHNPIGFVADRALLDTLAFDRFDLLDHADIFFAKYNHVLWLRSFPWLNRALFPPATMGGYMVPTGRGCPVECAYCGGSRSATRRTTGRARVTLRSPGAVLKELTRVAARGIDRLYFAYDPYPRSRYYPDLFARIAGEGMRFGAVFESFALPDARFLETFGRAFDLARSALVLSPETGDEALRAANRGYAYSNADFLAALGAIVRLGVHAHVSFTLGLPGETRSSLDTTRALWRRVRREFGKTVSRSATLIHLDPDSPAAVDPAARGVRGAPLDLSSLTALHRTSARDSFTGWSHLPVCHECPDLVADLADPAIGATDAILRRIKCRDYCHYFERLHLAYPWNRAACEAAGLLARAADRARGVPSRGRAEALPDPDRPRRV
jgi:radical SAM superfamily enzyme YgiQ (UPF0313 family)